MNARRSLPIAMLAAAIATGAHAQAATPIPRVMSFQGYMTNESGRPMDGVFDMTFRLFCSNDPAAPTCAQDRSGNPFDGSNPLWEFLIPGVRVGQGLFNVVLGDDRPASNAAAPLWVLDGGDRWVEIVVDGKVLSPRQRVAAAPFALRSLGALVIARAHATGEMLVDNAVSPGCWPSDDLTNTLDFTRVDFAVPPGVMSGGTFVAPYAGYYRVTATVKFDGQAWINGATVSLWLRHGSLSPVSLSRGFLDGHEQQADSTDQRVFLSGSDIVRLAQGESLVVGICVNAVPVPELNDDNATVTIELVNID